MDRCHEFRAGYKLLGRRRFLKRGLTATAVAGVPVSALPNQAADSAAEVAPFELDGVGVAELEEGMRSGKWTARALVEKYLARIAAIDRQGPALRGVIEVNPDALALADELDRQRKNRGPHGPLHGIPVLIKDNIDTADRMATTAGSLALVGAGRSATPSWSLGCGRPGPFCWARRILASGPTSAAAIPPAVGAAAAG